MQQLEKRLIPVMEVHRAPETEREQKDKPDIGSDLAERIHAQMRKVHELRAYVGTLIDRLQV